MIFNYYYDLLLSSTVAFSALFFFVTLIKIPFLGYPLRNVKLLSRSLYNIIIIYRNFPFYGSVYHSDNNLLFKVVKLV